MKLKIFALLIFSLLLAGKSGAQQVEKNAELGEVIRIVAAAQDIPFLSFQLTTIIEDSLNSPAYYSQKDTIKGIYKQSDGRYWAMMDSIEYVQGFNYNLALFHSEKLISVAKPSQAHPGMQLSLLDSTFQAAHVKSMTITQLDSVNRLFKIEFTSESPYSNYEMRYNMNTYQVNTVTYYIKNGYTRENETTSTAKITTTLFNYSTAPFDRDVFREEKYVYKSAAGMAARAAYEGYQIIMTRDDL